MEKNIKGISILESLVCLVIIGIGFVAMLQLSSFSINAMDRSLEIMHLTKLTVIIIHKVEQNFIKKIKINGEIN